MSADCDHIFKLLLIGDSGTGKSSILVRFTDDIFREEMSTTIGVDFKVRYIALREKRIKLTLWDTAGQERFRTLTSSFYRGAHGVILVYDITDRRTFESLSRWQDEVDKFSSFHDIVRLLVGNKIDRDDFGEREVEKSEGLAFAQQNGMMFIECSAKTKEGIEETFEEVTLKILDTESLVATSRSVALEDAIHIEPRTGHSQEDSDSGVCCDVF